MTNGRGYSILYISGKLMRISLTGIIAFGLGIAACRFFGFSKRPPDPVAFYCLLFMFVVSVSIDIYYELFLKRK